MLKRNRTMSIVMAVCLCLALLAPVFVLPQVAEASASYRALTVPTFANGTAASANMATIEVDIPSGMEATTGDILTFSFPKELTAATTLPATANNGIVCVDAVIPNAEFIQVVVPDLHPQTGQANGLSAGMEPFNTTGNLDGDSDDVVAWGEVSALDTSGNGTLSIAEIRAFGAPAAAFGNLSTAAYGVAANGAASAKVSSTGQSFDVKVSGAPTAGRGVLYVYLSNLALAGASGDITVSCMGSSAAFPYQAVIVGKVVSGGGSSVIMKSEKTIGSAAATLDTITFFETSKGSIVTGDLVKFKLPAGFKWNVAGGAAVGAGSANWDWLNIAGFTPVRDATDERLAVVTIPNIAGAPQTTTGRFDVILAPIIVADEAVAKKGDVIMHVSGTGNVSEMDVKVAVYGDYNAAGKEGTVKDLIAGKSDQKLGEFWLEEGLANSLIDGRSVKITLPKGVKWSGAYDVAGPVAPVADSGNATLGAITFTDTYRTMVMTATQVAAPATPSKSKFKFKDFRVDIAPDYTGPINVTFSGTASATGEVKVAEVQAPVELSAENVQDVRIGEQNQVLGDLIIKETKKENIAIQNANIDVWGATPVATTPDVAAAAGVLAITLPAGASWSAGYPTVEVTDGDLDLKANEMYKEGNVLNIPIKSESTVASTIKISGLKATINRTVPEGDFKLSVSGLAINETGGTAVNATSGATQNLAFAQYEAQSVAVAKCVTPAPDQGTTGAATGQFRINSNIYEVNGVAKVMDAAPYIKDGRTYMPIRFLGYAMGLTDADIVWDEATQKVTMTKGENVVELTVGSTTITVNGEAQTMDVAPEITNGRTMLPARFVAEGLGYVVGWDASTQTVLISK